MNISPQFIEFGKTPRELARDAKRQRRRVGDSYLTPREYVVVQMLATGVSGPEVAGKMGVSQKTVWGLTRGARERLGAKTNNHLVAICVRAGAV